ncbi:MAG: hypothetical protein LAP21_24740 [Acidobacteriia bacterium]|nr:hypothetical protein [Terriglobia bacterium]
MIRSYCLLCSIVLLVAPLSMAHIQDIDRQKLPQTPAVLKVCADVAEIEDMVFQWSEKWRFQVPREKVVGVLAGSLAELQKQLKASPENEELWLLTALVAHYAHNVDVEGAADAAVDSLENAHKLAPGDYRYGWFLGLHQCQIGEMKEGTDKMLAIEQDTEWQKLPVGFWDDYIFCTEISNMPAHVLRAADHLKKMKAPPSWERDALVDIAEKRLKTADPVATYPFREVWSVRKTDTGMIFMNSMFGIALWSNGDWKVSLSDIQQGRAMLQLESGPYSGHAGNVSPGLVVIARPPKAGETLSAFLQGAWPEGPALKASEAIACPVKECLAAEAIRPGGYKTEGDGHFFLTAFAGQAPEFPGLRFEESQGLPSSEEKGASYFRPQDSWRRLNGTLYYLVVLDTAESVVESARGDYQKLLRGIQLE